MQNIAEISIKYEPNFKMSELPKVSSSKDAYDILSDSWEDIVYRESFKILLLNRGNKVLGISTISKGGISGTAADPKIIFQIAIKANASSIILAHNHPSGNLKYSTQDLALTKKIIAAGKMLEIEVLDHIILTDSGYYSFADYGMIKE